MGGLATQYAVAQPDSYGGIVGDHVGAVITVGTPYQGSELLTAMQLARAAALTHAILDPSDWPEAALGEAVLSACAGHTSGICALPAVLTAPVGTDLRTVLQFDSRASAVAGPAARAEHRRGHGIAHRRRPPVRRAQVRRRRCRGHDGLGHRPQHHGRAYHQTLQLTDPARGSVRRSPVRASTPIWSTTATSLAMSSTPSGQNCQLRTAATSAGFTRTITSSASDRRST